jgi:hypothetical protein
METLFVAVGGSRPRSRSRQAHPVAVSAGQGEASFAAGAGTGYSGLHLGWRGQVFADLEDAPSSRVIGAVDAW